MKKLRDISEHYTPDLARYEEEQWLATEQWRQNSAFVLPLIQKLQVKTVVEFGCGTGLVARDLPEGLDYTGVDTNSWFLEKARARNRDRKYFFFQFWDIRTWHDDVKDLAMCWSVLKHFCLDEWPDILRRILMAGRHCAFNVQTVKGNTPFDNGTQFHHVFVPASMARTGIDHFGHDILHEEVTSEWQVDGCFCADITFLTRKRPGPGPRTGDEGTEKTEPVSGLKELTITH